MIDVTKSQFLNSSSTSMTGIFVVLVVSHPPLSLLSLNLIEVGDLLLLSMMAYIA